VGQYEPHANAKKAGVQQGDIVVSFDGREDLADETDLIAHALEKRPDDRVPLVLVRDGKRLTLSLPIAR
jgi:S1-C subfamily serine protease